MRLHIPVLVLHPLRDQTLLDCSRLRLACNFSLAFLTVEDLRFAGCAELRNKNLILVFVDDYGVVARLGPLQKHSVG